MGPKGDRAGKWCDTQGVARSHHRRPAPPPRRRGPRLLPLRSPREDLRHGAGEGETRLGPQPCGLARRSPRHRRRGPACGPPGAVRGGTLGLRLHHGRLRPGGGTGSRRCGGCWAAKPAAGPDRQAYIALAGAAEVSAPQVGLADRVTGYRGGVVPVYSPQRAQRMLPPLDHAIPDTGSLPRGPFRSARAGHAVVLTVLLHLAVLPPLSLLDSPEHWRKLRSKVFRQQTNLAVSDRGPLERPAPPRQQASHIRGPIHPMLGANSGP